MACQPLLNGFHFMNTVVSHHDIDMRDAWSRVGPVQYGQKVAKQSIVFARAKAVEYFATGKMECPSKIVFLVRAGRPDLFLCPLRPPGCPNLWQEVNIEFIGKDHDFMRLPMFMMKPNAGQPLDTLRVVIFGRQFGPFPYPAHLVEPAAYGFRRYRDAVFGLERGREGGTTPPGTAPAIGAWGGFEDSAQGAHKPGHQDGYPHGHGKLPVCWIEPYA